jgi:hypothetical protein
MQKQTCPSCLWLTGVTRGGVFVNHTVNGQRIRVGAKKDGRKCRRSGKQAGS